MKKRVLIFPFILIITAALSLSCNFVSNLGSKFSETKNTAEYMATKVESGQELIGTAKAFSTQISDNEILATAKAMATEVFDENYIETAQAYLTSEAPGALETLQAFSTENGPGILQTYQAYVTKMSENNNNPPPDIPLVPGDKENLYVSQELVSYFTSMEFQNVLTFYIDEMPKNGWNKVEQGWVENSNSAVLTYEKPNRSVSITLSINPLDNHTIVMITIQP